MMGKKCYSHVWHHKAYFSLKNKKIGKTDLSQKKNIVSIAILSVCRLQEDLYSLWLLVTFEDEKQYLDRFETKLVKG